MKADIFCGLVHYQRLRHMVSDKWQVRHIPFQRDCYVRHTLAISSRSIGHTLSIQGLNVTYIFYRLMDYLRLRHMVSDKWQVKNLYQVVMLDIFYLC